MIKVINILFETTKRTFSRVGLPGERVVATGEIDKTEKILSIQSSGYTEDRRHIECIDVGGQISITDGWPLTDKIGFYAVTPRGRVAE